MTKTNMEYWLATDSVLRNHRSSETAKAESSGSNSAGMTISIHAIDPLNDPRWERLVARHPRASIFHTVAWLKALRLTYGYTPVVYTTAAHGIELQNGIVFCEVNSWLTGKRLVSLPFSDHCQPLIDHGDQLQQVFTNLERLVQSKYWRYIELRPIEEMRLSPSVCHSVARYHFHELDLSPDLDTIFHNFHKDSIQRKIKRAEREGLIYREGRSAELLDTFYRMFCVTRQRHKVPPPPLAWLNNLIQWFGEDLKVRVAFHGDRPVAGMITIRHKDTLVYKYGCSNVRYNNLGGMHLLYWKSIQEAKNTGARVFDFGRCDFGQEGLKTFKRRWGAVESTLNYSRYAADDNAAMHFPPEKDSLKMKFAKNVFALLPVRFLSALGGVLYKHVG